MSLSSRNIISMCVILFATTTLSGLGPTTLAAHEILRQVWIFAIQVLVSASTSAAPQLSLCFQKSWCFTDQWADFPIVRSLFLFLGTALVGILGAGHRDADAGGGVQGAAPACTGLRGGAAANSSCRSWTALSRMLGMRAIPLFGCLIYFVRLTPHSRDSAVHIHSSSLVKVAHPVHRRRCRVQRGSENVVPTSLHVGAQAHAAAGDGDWAGDRRRHGGGRRGAALRLLQRRASRWHGPQ